MNETLQQLIRKAPLDPDRWKAFLRYVWGQFGKDQCLQSAGMLTYATLLSLVPMLIVVLSTAAAMPGADQWNEQIQQFLFKYFLPDAQQTITEKLSEWTRQTTGITATMGLFLIVTSLILMSNIENALNRIWGVHTARSITGKFMVYWSMLTLGPVLLGASLALSSYFSLAGLFEQARIGALKSVTEMLTPYLVASLAFFLLFMIVPNRWVPWRHAAFGALLTGLLFEVAKKGFGLYVSTFKSYTVLYGALGSIPIFLVWVYLSWSVILLGASMTASIDSFRFRRPGERWTDRDRFVLLYRVVGHLWDAQKEGRSLSVNQLLDREPSADDHQIQELLENLRISRLVSRDEDGDWVLGRDLARVTLEELYGTGDYVWPLAPDQVRGNDAWASSLKTVLEDLSEPMKRATGCTLKSLYAEAGPRKVETEERCA